MVISSLFDAFQAGTDLTTEALLATIRQMVPLSVTMKEAIDGLRSWASARARPASSPGKPEEIPDAGRSLEL